MSLILKLITHCSLVSCGKNAVKSMRKVLSGGVALLRGRRARDISSDRIFKLTVHCTHKSLINNNFSMYTVHYTLYTVQNIFLPY